MPVDVKDFRRLAREQKESEGATPPAQPVEEQIQIPRADLSEFKVELPFMDELLPTLEVEVSRLRFIQQDAAQRAMVSLQEAQVRQTQCRYWEHRGMEEGIVAVLNELKKIAHTRSLIKS